MMNESLNFAWHGTYEYNIIESLALLILTLSDDKSGMLKLWNISTAKFNDILPYLLIQNTNSPLNDTDFLKSKRRI